MSLPVRANPVKRGARDSYYACADFDPVDQKTEYDVEKRISTLQHSLSTESFKSISHNDHKHHKFYKPAANQSWVFLLFLVALATCIALLQATIVVYPDQNAVPPLPSLVPRHITVEHRSVLWLRQDDAAATETVDGDPSPDGTTETVESDPTPDGTTENIENDSKPDDTSEPDSGTSEPDSGTSPAPGDDSSNGGSSTSSDGPSTSVSDLPSASAFDQLLISSTQPADGSDKITVTIDTTPTPAPVVEPIPETEPPVETPGFPAPESQILNSAPASNTAPAVVTLDGAATVVSGSLIASGTDIVGTLPQSASASIVSGSLVVSGTSVLATVQPSAGSDSDAAAAGLVTLTDSAGRATATVAYTGNVVITGANGEVTTISYGNAIVLTDSNGVPTKTLSNGIVLTDSNGRPTATVSYENMVLTDSNGVPTKTVLYTGLATQTADAASNETDKKPIALTSFTYFLAIYLPNILGVLLQASWLIVFATFKVMEPFYELASPNGASAASTLIADYLSSSLSLSIFSRVLEGHYVLVLAGLVQFGLAWVVTLGSESMTVVATAYCEIADAKQQRCNPVWVVNTVMLRVVQVLLVGCFSMVIMILVLNRKRVSGVYADPTSIATMADLLVHKPFIHELRDIPASASATDIAHDLRDSQYMLGTFVDKGREYYGLVKLNTEADRSRAFVKESALKALQHRLGTSIEHFSERIMDVVPFLPDFLCMVLAIILFSIVLAFAMIDPKRGYNSFNAWMSGGAIGPKSLLSGLAVLMGFLVKRKERFLRLSHPYVVLAKRPTLASEVITPGMRKSSFSSIYKAFNTKDAKLSLMSLAAVLSDIILIMAPTVPFSGSQTRNSYLASTFIVLPMSGIICLITAYVVFKEWSTGNRYDNCPETMAATMMRLCASRFVEEKNMINAGPQGELFDGDDDESQRIRYEGRNGQRKYVYGVMEGVDGVQRYMVEEDIHAPPSFQRSM